MRLSDRLLSNAATTYLSLGATFALGLFTTRYLLGAAGTAGFGLLALGVSGSGPARALERTLRIGLVRDLSAALAADDSAAVRRSVAAAFRLCSRAVVPLLGLSIAFAAVAWVGGFRVPDGRRELMLALAVLILAEGAHAAVRLVGAPFLQCLFASQHVALDNLLVVLARLSYALSAVLVFGWLSQGAALSTQLLVFAGTRVTVQLADVGVGVWLARRLVPGLRLDRSVFDEKEYRTMRATVFDFSQVNVLLNLTPRLMAILINLFFGIAYNAIWEVAVQFAGFAWMASKSLLRGIAPLTAHLEADGRRPVALDLMTRSIRYQLTGVLPAALVLGVYAKPLLGMWVGGRLAADPYLAAGGLDATGALSVATSLATVLLVVHVVRASFFGAERILYGLGRVHSYAWFAKWATLLAVVAAAVAIALSAGPIAAPLSMLAGIALYSLGAVPRAVRRELGLELGSSLRRSLPRSLISNLLFFGMLWAARPYFDPLTPAQLVVLLLGSGITYGALTLLLISEADERLLLRELARRLVGLD